MKTLNTQARLGFAQAGIAVLRAISTSGREMTYREFAEEIGLLAENDKWEVWHRNQLTDTLNLMAATARQAGSKEIDSLKFERLIHKGNGEPGAGFYKTCRIECKK